MLAAIAALAVVIAAWFYYKKNAPDETDTKEHFIFNENGTPVTDPQQIKAFTDKMNAVRGNIIK